MDQIGLPVEVDPATIAMKANFGKSLEYCAELGGLHCNKQLAAVLDSDNAQLTRFKDDKEGIKWPKLQKLMTVCGNDAPLLWMLYQQGYDITTLRKRETEIERELRETQEALAESEREKEVMINTLRQIKAVG